jgi:hypothetical protein
LPKFFKVYVLDLDRTFLQGSNFYKVVIVENNLCFFKRAFSRKFKNKRKIIIAMLG